MKRLLALLGLLLVMPIGFAEPIPPDTLARNVSTEVLEIIRQDRDIQAGNMGKTVALVETKVLPHFNFTRMTALAMGPNWRKATPEQQKLLTEEFKTLLVRTYSTALVAYRNQAIDFKPLRAQASDAEVVVKSEVRQPGQQAVTIDYSMEKTSETWKVYDVAVGGISLVTTYRDTFTSEVRQHGIDGLIKSLAARNRQLETTAKT